MPVAPQSQTHPCIAALLDPCSISNSLVQTFPLRYNIFVSKCIIHESLIIMLSSVFFTIHVFPSSDLVAYYDADWGGCLVSHRSTSSYCVFIRDNLISWSLKRRGIISQSSAKEKYRGVANFVAETCWVCNLL